MPLLSIVKSVMDSNGWPDVVTSVASNNADPNMRQAFALANKVLRDLSFKKNWPILTREHAFVTVPGQQDYPLPADFHHLVSPSAVNADQYYAMKGSLTPIQWYRYLLNGSFAYNSGGVNWVNGFRIDPFAKTFRIVPIPTSEVNLVFMYVTNLIATDSGGNPTTQYSQDTDIAIIDEEIVEQGLSWRWRQKKGLDYTAELAEAQATFNTRFAQELAFGELPVGARAMSDIYPLTPGYIGSGPIGL